MFLKSLEIKGFKSFADKTELKFKEGITAVVGPNGSGKSNVSDSVRWVLGEQSAKILRGSKMEDIIFSGTDYRKPLGLAQVSLTLDNSKGELPIDYNDVKVTRKVFRSGDSEYLINNTPCRLKDITNLFMDTGIGKEGYSLIGQGKIDAILNGKAEDRRALLEEAAGIVKFKSRKIEAEKKLENTNENLVRINDIIYTYEERITPLQEEKVKAETYLNYANELREKEVSLILNNINKLKKEIEAQKEKIDILSNSNLDYKNRQKKQRDKLNTLKQNIEFIEKNKGDKQKDYFNKKENISKLTNDIEILKEKINSLESYIKNNNLELLEKEKILKSLKEEKEKIQENKLNKNKELVELDNYITALENKICNLDKELKENEKHKENIKENEIKFLKDTTENEKKIVLLENQNASFLDNIKSIEDSKLALDNSLKINIKTKLDLDNKLNDLISEKNDLQNKIENYLKKEKDLEIEIEKINNELSNIYKEVSTLEANKEILETLEKQYEGYSFSVKNLMKSIHEGELKLYNKSCFVLGDVVKSNSGYETAIEIALGAAISNIITENEEIAKKLIEYLKKKRLGRATFLPLTTIKSNRVSLDNNIKSTNGYLCLASEAVKFEKRFENVINNVLGKVIICDYIDNALLLAKKINYKNRIITLAGDVINAGGSLTGGSISQKKLGIMSRKTEIESLSEKIIKNNLKKDTISVSLNEKKKEIVLLASFKEEITEKIYNNKIDIVNLKNKIDNLNIDINKSKSALSSSNMQIDNLNQKITKGTEEILKIKENLRIIQNKEKEDVKFLEKINLDLNMLFEEILKSRVELTSFKVKKAKNQEILTNALKDIKRYEEEYKSYLNRCNYLKEAIYINSIEKEENIKRIKENTNTIEKQQEELILLEKDAKDYEDKRKEVKIEIENIENNLENITLDIAKKEQEIYKNEMIYEKQQNEARFLSSRLKDEFNTNEENEKFTPIEDLQRHKKEVENLKNKINKLGQVNVNAIEEFKEVSQKYNFIKMEKEDLENAKKELLTVIDEMLSKMRVVFRQNFNILNKNFQETFKELFKGGNAKLILDSDDELLGNIEINVQPPGKKVQNINLMSGGEKVLSAIAILFAILKMKPTPFCILDEIEAALDDANVNRYAEFLKKISKDVQFIVITHRKGTMEASDIMYGVTMEEKGVSKIISIDLEK